jgi:hypothetical protein
VPLQRNTNKPDGGWCDTTAYWGLRYASTHDILYPNVLLYLHPSIIATPRRCLQRFIDKKESQDLTERTRVSLWSSESPSVWFFDRLYFLERSQSRGKKEARELVHRHGINYSRLMLNTGGKTYAFFHISDWMGARPHPPTARKRKWRIVTDPSRSSEFSLQWTIGTIISRILATLSRVISICLRFCYFLLKRPF